MTDLMEQMLATAAEYGVDMEHDTVRRHLAQELALLRQNHRRNPLAYEGPQGFVLRHGIDFTSPPDLPDGYEWMEAKNCYGNAAQLALEDPALTYVEGYAMGRFFPIPHAWVVTEDGTVIDPTWAPWEGEAADSDVPRAEWQYVGVPFTTKFLSSELQRNRTYGLLDQWETGYRMLKRRLPQRAVPKRWRDKVFSPQP
jgi:hypothetical protein